MTVITIDNPNNIKRVSGDGSTVEFTVNMRIFQSSYLRVYVYPEDLDFDDIEDYRMTEGSGADYTVEVDEDGAGATITAAVAPTSNEEVMFWNVLPIEQTEDFPTEGYFPEETVEQALDRIVAILQQHQEQLNRCIKLPIIDPLNNDTTFDEQSLTLPPSTNAARASKAIVFNSDGDGLEYATN